MRSAPARLGRTAGSNAPGMLAIKPYDKRTGAPKNRTGMIFSFSEDRTPSLFSFETPDDPEAEKKTINSADSSRGLAASRAGGWVGRRGARVAKG